MDYFQIQIELESFFYRTIPPLTYKTYLKNKTSKKTKKGKWGLVIWLGQCQI